MYKKRPFFILGRENMITKYCKSCGAQVVIDENKDKFFCSSCGAENIVDSINNGFVPNTFQQPMITAPIDPLNSPNIYFDFKTVPSHLKMYINIPCTGKEYVFNGGESIELHLPVGMQVIKFRIGSTTFTKTISIQNGFLIHVNCSWNNGKFYINSDYPQLIMNGAVNQQGNPGTKKSGWGCLGVGIAVVVVIFLISSISSYLNAAKKARTTSNNNDASTAVASGTSAGLDKDAFIASCSELDYKAIARNPENYIGQNFYYMCYVSSARTSKSNQKYYITYAFDMDKAKERIESGWSENFEDAADYCKDYDVCVWLNDGRNESDIDYVKILEKDVVLVYGTFTGMESTQNSLTGETGEEVSLDIKYAYIVSDIIDTEEGESQPVLEQLVGYGYTIEQAETIQELLAECGITDLSTFVIGDETDVEALVTLYDKSQEDITIWIVIDNGELYYIGYNGEDIYTQEDGVVATIDDFAEE